MGTGEWSEPERKKKTMEYDFGRPIEAGRDEIKKKKKRCPISTITVYAYAFGFVFGKRIIIYYRCAVIRKLFKKKKNRRRFLINKRFERVIVIRDFIFVYLA